MGNCRVKSHHLSAVDNTAVILFRQDVCLGTRTRSGVHVGGSSSTQSTRRSLAGIIRRPRPRLLSLQPSINSLRRPGSALVIVVAISIRDPYISPAWPDTGHFAPPRTSVPRASVEIFAFKYFFHCLAANSVSSKSEVCYLSLRKPV